MRRAAVANRSQSSKALKIVKELDAFPKVPDNFKETTASGGGISLVTFVFIFILVISEIQYYTNTELKFEYAVDTELEGKLQINIDMTVAMRCEFMGADILDQTGQDTYSFGKLEMTSVPFELTPQQKRFHEITRQVNQYMREEYHAIQELLWISGHTPLLSGMPRSDLNPENRPLDGCRVHGSLDLNKVAGNFHITAGKSIPVIPRGHAHLAMMVSESDYNFSHRIDHFSFGERHSGIVNPLDGEEQITKNNYHLFQYFMKIVPTEVNTYANNLNTYQFSVTERNRTISHSGGSHGVPGIFVKYDLTALKIKVMEQHKPYWQFLVRLCGIIGGVFVVSGLLHDGVGLIVDILCCRFKIGKYGDTKTIPVAEPVVLGGPSETFNHQYTTLPTNNLQNSDTDFNPVDLVTDSYTGDSIKQNGTNLLSSER